MSADRRVLVSLTSALLAACATHHAPRGFLLDTREAQSQAVGGWIEVRSGSEPGAGEVMGELLAATADSLWIMTSARPVVLSTAEVTSGRLVGYDAHSGQVATATVLGVLSTISNGVFLVFSAPMWAIGGTLAAASQSRVPMEGLPAARWTDLARFARYPQGIPASVDLEALRPLRR